MRQKDSFHSRHAGVFLGLGKHGVTLCGVFLLPDIGYLPTNDEDLS